MLKMISRGTKQAGQKCTLYSPSCCPKNGEYLKDLSPEVRAIFHDFENHPEILRIKFGRFSSKMPKSQSNFSLKLKEPEINSGIILGKLKGPGKIGGIQRLLIETIKGKEWHIYLTLRNYPWAEY